MIRTWAAAVTPLLEDRVYQEYYREVPEFRREKADRLRTRQSRAQSVGVWALLERMRSFYDLGETAVFNLSHSGNYVLCAADDSGKPDVRVGCDIEVIGRMRERVADRFFCASEAAYILGQPSQEARTEAFYRYWVLKESFVKALRLGLKVDLSHFEIAFDGADRPVLIRQPEGVEGTYYYREYVQEGIPARIAVCSTAADFGELEVVTLER